ncbi:MAG: DinB family protein [Chloroflexi bacterium]|nr:DinB family protein [Chloroflexota bacterium]
MIPEVKKLADKMQAARAKLIDVLESASEAQRKALIYEEGWNLYDLLSHIATAENENVRFLSDVIAADGARHQPRENVSDVNEWNAQAVAGQRGLTWAERMAALQAARATTLAVLEGVDAAAFAHRGTHAVWGEKDVSALVKILYLHDIMHRNDIVSKLKAGAA